MMRFPVRNVFELPRVRKQRPVLVQTRKKAAGKAVQLLVRKGYLRREKRDTPEFEPVQTFTLDTTELRRYVLELRRRLAQTSGHYLDSYVLLVNPRYFRGQCSAESAFYQPVPIDLNERPSFGGMEVYLWSGIDSVIAIPKSVFKTA